MHYAGTFVCGNVLPSNDFMVNTALGGNIREAVSYTHLGTKLRDDFGFKSDLKKIAEGWMLSCHKDGENIIDGGKFDGKTCLLYTSRCV